MDNGRVPNDPEPRDPDVIDPVPAIPAAPAGQRPPLGDDGDTVAIPRPGNELDDGEALEEPDDDPAKAG